MVLYSAWKVLVKRSIKILQKERIVNCRLTLKVLVANCKFHSKTASKILIRPGKLDLLFCISHFFDLHAAGGHYSLFITCKCYIHSTNLWHYGH